MAVRISAQGIVFDNIASIVAEGNGTFHLYPEAGHFIDVAAINGRSDVVIKVTPVSEDTEEK